MELSAKARDIKKDKIKEVRKSGYVPAVIYSKKSSVGEKPVLSVSVNKIQFEKIYVEAGETSIVTLNIDDKSKAEVLIHDIQRDPMSLDIIHVGFFEVDLSQTIDTSVPIEIINEDDHELVKAGEGLVIKLLDEIEVRCLPNNIPSQFEVDALQLKEVNDVLSVKDSINFDESKVELLTDLEEVVVKLDYAEQLEEEEEEPVDVDDVEVLSEKPEGEEGADSGDSEETAAPAEEEKAE